MTSALLCLLVSISVASPVATEKIEQLERIFSEIEKDSVKQRKLVGGLLSAGSVFGAFMSASLQATNLTDEASASQLLFGSSAMAISGFWILAGSNPSEADSAWFHQEREYSIEGVQRVVQFGEQSLEKISNRAGLERLVDGSILIGAGAYNLSLATASETTAVRDQTGSSGLGLTLLGSAWSLRERRLFGSGLIAIAGYGNLIANVWQRGNPAKQYFVYSGALWICAGIWHFVVPRIEETAWEEYLPATALVPVPGGAVLITRFEF